MDRSIVECLGTFVLVLVIGLVAFEPNAAGDLGAVAIASALIGVIYAGGHVSRAHYNPAISLAFALRGGGFFARRDWVPYVLAQLVGSALAVGAVLVIAPETAPPAREFAVVPTIVAEMLFTCVLAFVILHVATSARLAGNQFYGVAIGLTVLGAIVAVGPVSGAVLNPAVELALCLLGAVRWSDAWMHLVGQGLGAVLAVGLFRLTERPADASD